MLILPNKVNIFSPEINKGPGNRGEVFDPNVYGSCCAEECVNI